MDITNSTSMLTEYRVTSRQAARTGEQATWKDLEPNDYDVVRPAQAGPWTVEFRMRGQEPIAEVVESPKASVVLAGAVGEYHVEASVAPLDAFISYSPSEGSWAEALDNALRKSGVSTWFDARILKPGLSLREQIERAIAQARNIVVLIGPEDTATSQQLFERMTALEAVWRDSSKRMIPVLIGNARLPSFVRTAAHWSRTLAAIRVGDPLHDWDQAVAGLTEVLRSEADPRNKGEVLDTIEEDRRLRQERLSYIKKVAEDLE